MLYFVGIVLYLQWIESGGEKEDSEISEVINYNGIYDFWVDLRVDFLEYYEEKSDAYSAAIFIYCMLNE